MTNIAKKAKSSNMHSHIIEKAFDFINEWLPTNYVGKVQAKLTKDKMMTSGIIRNVRNRINPNEDNYIEVINLLVEVATDNKAALDQLQKSVSSTQP